MVSHFYFENGFIWGLLFFFMAAFFSKRTDFPKHYGVTGVTILYSLAVVRCIFIIEPFFTITINIWDGLPQMYTALSRELLIAKKSFSLLQIFLIIWLAGTVFLVGRQVIFAILTHRLLKRNSVACREDYIKVYREMYPNGKLKIMQTDILDSPAIAGIIRPILYLPKADYSLSTVRNIFLHEQYHYRHRDLAKKLIFTMMGCVLWWNPFVIFAEKRMDYIFEVNCDYQVLKNASNEAKEEYVEAIMEVVKTSIGKKAVFGAIAFTGKRKNDTVERCKRILEIENRKKNFPWLILWGLTCLLSYAIVFQPAWEVDMTSESGSELIINRETAYIEKMEDGTYILHIEGNYDIPMTEEEISIPPCDTLEVKEK